MTEKGRPLQNGSGNGTRSNQGRGGCANTQQTGQGRRK